jgi:hypothetical protein
MKIKATLVCSLRSPPSHMHRRSRHPRTHSLTRIHMHDSLNTRHISHDGSFGSTTISHPRTKCLVLSLSYSAYKVAMIVVKAGWIAIICASGCVHTLLVRVGSRRLLTVCKAWNCAMAVFKIVCRAVDRMDRKYVLSSCFDSIYLVTLWFSIFNVCRGMKHLHSEMRCFVNFSYSTNTEGPKLEFLRISA